MTGSTRGGFGKGLWREGTYRGLRGHGRPSETDGEREGLGLDETRNYFLIVARDRCGIVGRILNLGGKRFKRGKRGGSEEHGFLKKKCGGSECGP